MGAYTGVRNPDQSVGPAVLGPETPGRGGSSVTSAAAAAACAAAAVGAVGAAGLAAGRRV